MVDQENLDKLELSITLLKSLRDTMISIDSVDANQVIPVTTLSVFETVIDKIQMLLKAVMEDL